MSWKQSQPEIKPVCESFLSSNNDIVNTEDVKTNLG